MGYRHILIMKSNYRIILSIIFIIIQIINIEAQQDTLPSDEQQIIKDFEADLDDFDKVDIRPALPSIDTQRQVLEYSGEPVLLNLDYDAPKIKPKELATKSNEEIYNGFVKLGLGYPLQGFADVGYSKKSESWLIGGKASYLGAFNTWNLEHQVNQEANARINADHYFYSGFSVGADVNYNLQLPYFYGYDHDIISYDINDVKQYISLADAGIHFKNNFINFGDIDYAAEVRFYNVKDNFIALENGLNAHLRFDKYLGDDKHLIQILVNDDYRINQTDTVNNNNNLLSIEPSFTYHHDKFRIKAGVDLFLDENQFDYIPDVEIAFNVYKNNAQLYLGWKGDIGQGSFKNFSQENPYIVSNPELQNTKVQYPYMGIDFNFKKTHLGLEGGYKMIKNQSLYLNDWINDGRRFRVVYDDINMIVSRFFVQSEVIEGLDLDLTLNYQNIQLEQLSAAYHIAAPISGDISLTYHQLVDKKMSLGTRIFLTGERPYLDALGMNENLPFIFDWNIFTEYRLSNQFKLFAQVNNIANQKYSLWNEYPNFGINGLVGFMYKFGKQ